MTAKKIIVAKVAVSSCVFSALGRRENSAKVGAVGKIRVVQWAAQAEPEFPLECPLET